MKKILLPLIIILFMVLIPVFAIADTVYLLDGSIIVGDIIEINEDNIVIVTKAGELTIDKDDIVRIEFEIEEEENDEYAEMRERIKEELEKLGKEDSEDVVVVVVVIEKEPENGEEEEPENNEPDVEEEPENNEPENNENVWEVDEDNAEEEDYDWANNDNNNEEPQWNNDDDENQYDWPEEDETAVEDFGFISGTMELGFIFNWDFYWYSLYSIDIGINMGKNFFLNLSLDLPNFDDYFMLGHTGFGLDIGFSTYTRDGFFGTKWFEMQTGIIFLYPMDYDYEEYVYILTLTILLGYDYRFGDIELINAGFVEFTYQDIIGFSMGWKFGLRFYY